MIFSLLSSLWPSFVKENVAVCPGACFTTFYEAACFQNSAVSVPHSFSWLCLILHMVGVQLPVVRAGTWVVLPAWVPLHSAHFKGRISAVSSAAPLLSLSCLTIKFQSFMCYWTQNCQLKFFKPEREFVGWRSLWLQDESGADICLYLIKGGSSLTQRVASGMWITDRRHEVNLGLAMAQCSRRDKEYAVHSCMLSVLYPDLDPPRLPT